MTEKTNKPKKTKEVEKSSKKLDNKSIDDLLKDVPEDAKVILESLPEDKQHKLISVFRASHFSGPLPPPELLAGYESVLPGGAERIFLMTENQAEHRREIEKKVISSQIALNEKGQKFAFAIVMLAFISAFAFVFMGFPAIAATILGTTVLGIVAPFLQNYFSEAKEKKDKTKS